MYCEKIVDQILEKADLKKYIKENNLRCKKCGRKVTVSSKYKIYCCPKCLSNGSCGNVVTAIMESQNVDFYKAIEYIAKKENVFLEKCVLNKIPSKERCQDCGKLKEN